MKRVQLVIGLSISVTMAGCLSADPDEGAVDEPPMTSKPCHGRAPLAIQS
jgi:hypothetical protein